MLSCQVSEYRVSIDEDNRDRNLDFRKFMNELCRRDGEYNRDGESNVFEIDEIQLAVLNEYTLDYVLQTLGYLEENMENDLIEILDNKHKIRLTNTGRIRCDEFN